MATFRVIKAHDGLALGDLRVLEPCAITDYMIENGYWEEVKDESQNATKATKTTVKTTSKKSK